VVHAQGVLVSVSNITNPGQPFAVGDTARITLSGLQSPVEKLAGTYNPGFNGASSAATTTCAPTWNTRTGLRP